MTSKELKAGKILLAEPFMVGQTFKRSAILLTDHSKKEGSIGFILNKPLEMNISQLVADFPEFDAQVYYGGPVSHDTIHYVHNIGELLEESIEIEKGVYWGGDFEKLKFLIESKLVLESNIKFFVGYSGWSKGQLAEEMEHGSWVLAQMHPNYVFKNSYKKLWSKIMSHQGDTYSVIAQMPEGHNLN